MQVADFGNVDFCTSENQKSDVGVRRQCPKYDMLRQFRKIFVSNTIYRKIMLDKYKIL